MNEEKAKISKNPWLEKLQTSSKNILLKKKQYDDKKKFRKRSLDKSKDYFLNDKILVENYDKKYLNILDTKKWENLNRLSKEKDLDCLSISQSIVKEANHEGSVISENLEEINYIIEENFKMSVTENIFLRSEYHSIIPFLLISSKEIHRLVLSDYEIKEIIRSFSKKSKQRKLDGFEYYRIGLINFYKGDYYTAYHNFKIGYNLINQTRSDSLNTGVNLSAYNNLCKWLAFTGLIILFVVNQKKTTINFSHLKQLEIKEKGREESPNHNMFITCCSVRKNSQHKYQNGNFNFSHGYSITNERDPTVDNSFTQKPQFLASEIEELLENVKNNALNELEAWWLQMYICIYCNSNPEQKIFKKFLEQPYEAVYCVKKIKELDPYLSYIAFAELHFILDSSEEKFKIDEILKELIFKFSFRYEAYLKYWQILVQNDSKFKNNKKAHALSESMWKISSSLKFENNSISIYYLYILITHAKSSYLIGNSGYTINFFQKEYVSNFLYPTIFFLVSNIKILWNFFFNL
jgi:hypothetical protein